MNAYALSNEELVDGFFKAAARAGTANSGLVIDSAAGHKLETAGYMKGAVLARLDNQQPPFEQGAIVRLKPGGMRQASEYWGPAVNSGEEYTIHQVIYKNRSWYLTLKEVEAERGTPTYPANQFVMQRAVSAGVP